MPDTPFHTPANPIAICAEISAQAIQCNEKLIKQYRTLQDTLLSHLADQSKAMRTQIEYFKKETSRQQVEKLIYNRRMQREQERIEKESEWRAVNQKFKEMQEKEKILKEEVRQAEFDVGKLIAKTKELENINASLRQQLESINKEINRNSHNIRDTNHVRDMPDSNSFNLTEVKNSRHQQAQSTPKLFQIRHSVKPTDKKILGEQKTNVARIERLGEAKLEVKPSPTVVKSRMMRDAYVDKKHQSERDLLKFLDDPEIRAQLYDLLVKGGSN